MCLHNLDENELELIISELFKKFGQTYSTFATLKKKFFKSFKL